VNFHWKGAAICLVSSAECAQLVLERVEVGEVVGGEDLALDDGEVDLGRLSQLRPPAATTPVGTPTGVAMAGVVSDDRLS
jgi:hypothetical protein